MLGKEKRAVLRMLASEGLDHCRPGSSLRKSDSESPSFVQSNSLSFTSFPLRLGGDQLCVSGQDGHDGDFPCRFLIFLRHKMWYSSWGLSRSCHCRRKKTYIGTAESGSPGAASRDRNGYTWLRISHRPGLLECSADKMPESRR